jgi:hypothetical protein
MRSESTGAASLRTVRQDTSEIGAALSYDETSLEKKRAELINQGGATCHQPFAHPMKRLEIELLRCLQWNEAHGGALHGLGNRFRVNEIILIAFHEGADVLRRHEADVVALRGELATEEVRATAGLHADVARRQRHHKADELQPRESLPRYDATLLIEADEVKRRLAEIDADRDDLHGPPPLIRLALAAPGSHTSQRRGRTIPYRAPVVLREPPEILARHRPACCGERRAVLRAVGGDGMSASTLGRTISAIDTQNLRI